MFVKKICVTLVSASMVLVPVQKAQASDAAAILGGLIVGGIIVNEVSKNKKRKQATQRQSTTNSHAYNAQREQNRQVQASLNYFGYNVGTVDGSIGRNTRNGIARYQSDMGFQADGRMDNYERDFLLTSKQRAEASGNVAPYNSILASQGRGGLLRTFRNEQLGVAPVQPAAAAAPIPVPVPAPVAAPTPVAAPANTAALPEFTFGQANTSISDFCNQINTLTAANGGVTAGTRVVDTEFALNEQFCLARTHAMADSTSIEATIPNMTSAQIETQCKGLTQAVAPHLKDIGAASPDSVINATLSFMQQSGQPMGRLISGGKVCLGIGYRVDDADMALASAVLLASGGLLGYGEIVSHHMREGFATARTSPQKAAEWMTLALKAMTSGGPVVLGQSADRVAVLTAAMKGGQAGVAALPVFPSGN